MEARVSERLLVDGHLMLLVRVQFFADFYLRRGLRRRKVAVVSGLRLYSVFLKVGRTSTTSLKDIDRFCPSSAASSNEPERNSSFSISVGVSDRFESDTERRIVLGSDCEHLCQRAQPRVRFTLLHSVAPDCFYTRALLQYRRHFWHWRRIRSWLVVAAQDTF